MRRLALTVLFFFFVSSAFGQRGKDQDLMKAAEKRLEVELVGLAGDNLDLEETCATILSTSEIGFERKELEPLRGLTCSLRNVERTRKEALEESLIPNGFDFHFDSSGNFRLQKYYSWGDEDVFQFEKERIKRVTERLEIRRDALRASTETDRDSVDYVIAYSDFAFSLAEERQASQWTEEPNHFTVPPPSQLGWDAYRTWAEEQERLRREAAEEAHRRYLESLEELKLIEQQRANAEQEAAADRQLAATERLRLEQEQTKKALHQISWQLSMVNDRLSY